MYPGIDNQILGAQRSPLQYFQPSVYGSLFFNLWSNSNNDWPSSAGYRP